MGRDLDLHVDLQSDGHDSDLPGPAESEFWVRSALTAADVNGAVEVSIRVVGKTEMQVLNRDYRHQDRPTNVLSFPAGPVIGLPADLPRFLGDIVICAPVIRAEAVAQGKAPGDHWAHMLVHGTLHLLGFDHIDEAGAARMEALEAQILATMNIVDPYSAR